MASGRVVMGVHHLALAIFADTPRALELATNHVEGILSNAGATPAVEDIGLEAAFFSLLPGTSEWQTRPGAITSLNFAHLASLENFPAGETEGYWGAPVVRFASTGGTPFDFVTHVEDVGHGFVVGRSGSGKTAFAMFLAAQMEQTGATGLVFDKDRGCEIPVRLAGGDYLALRRGRPSGMAPLKGLADTPANRAFLKNAFVGLIERDGRGSLTPDEEARLAQGIARQMEMPPALRSMTGVRERMGYADPQGAGARFEKWCRAGSMGWLYDNGEDLIRQDARLLGYDFTELLPGDEALSDDGAAEAAASYIVHRLRGVMDGRRMWMFCDECRFYLPVLGRILEDMALTGRKKELSLTLAAQEPDHLASHPVGLSLLSQCRTVIAFPNANASETGYRGALRFTEAEYAKITGDMLVGGGRCFLVKRESGSVICRFDLSPLPDFLKALSARAGTSLLLSRLIERHGDDPAVLWPAFRAALDGRVLSLPERLAVAAE